jgi:hypothetical protein
MKGISGLDEWLSASQLDLFSMELIFSNEICYENLERPLGTWLQICLKTSVILIATLNKGKQSLVPNLFLSIRNKVIKV